jgi:hypothetical protein
MIRSKKEYIQLPGSYFSLKTSAKLFLGKDHLLSLQNTGYTESYKRFYFKDIQAIVAQKTGDGMLWSIVHAIFTAAWILLALIIDKPVYSFVFGWIPAGIFLISFLVNILSGPTCVSYIYTAVTKEKLRSLNRLRKAQKVMVQLRPFIDNAQGRLTAEVLSAKGSMLKEKVAKEIEPRIVSQGEKETVPYYDGRYHEILFYVLFLFGLQDFIKFIFNHIAITFLGWVLFLVVGILVVISIVKQHTSIMKKEGWLMGITWATLVYLFVYFNVNYFIIMITSLKNIEHMQHGPEMMSIFSQTSPLDNFYITIFYIVSIVYAFTSVALGLVLLRRYKHEIEGYR